MNTNASNSFLNGYNPAYDSSNNGMPFGGHLDMSQQHPPPPLSSSLGPHGGPGMSQHNFPPQQQQTYNVPPVIPAKRPRDDNAVATVGTPVGSILSPSPQLNHSRSQTPQQQPGSQHFQGTYGGGPPPTSQAFPSNQGMYNPQFQPQASSQHGSPSPGPQGPAGQPRQMAPPIPQQLNSPHQMSGNFPNFANHPHLQNSMNRINAAAAHNPNAHHQRAMLNAPGFNHGQPSMPSQQGGSTGVPQSHYPPGQTSGGMMTQQQMDMQRAQFMRQQQQQLQAQTQAMQARNTSTPQPQPSQSQQQNNSNQMSPLQQMSRHNGHQAMQNHPQAPHQQMPQQQHAQQVHHPNQMHNPQQQQQQQQQQGSEANFMKALVAYVQSVGQPLNPKPEVLGRQIPYFMLFQLVFKQNHTQGPSPARGDYSMIAQKMGFPQEQLGIATQELKACFEQNLAGFYTQYEQNQNKKRAYFQAMQQQKMGQQQAGQMAQPQGSPSQSTHPQQIGRPPQMPQQSARSSTTPTFPPQMQHPAQHSMQGNAVPAQGSSPPPQSNGINGPAQAMQNFRGQTPMSAHGRSGSSVTRGQSIPKSPFPLDLPGGLQSPPHSPQAHIKSDQKSQLQSAHTLIETIRPKLEDEKLFMPRYRFLDNSSWGGYDRLQLTEFGCRLSTAKPSIPEFHEMGIVDVHALTMSLQSGLHSEERYALDMLVMLSRGPLVQRPRTREEELDISSVPSLMGLDPKGSNCVLLHECEDLVDTLLDTAEDLIKTLKNGCPKEEDDGMSDGFSTMMSFEDVENAAKYEVKNELDPQPQFASQCYARDKAASKLIAVTTILRNFSFLESNAVLLAGSGTVKVISGLVRAIGLQPSLLRTRRNLQDLYKDLIVFLSNIAHRIELGSKEQAMHILQLILAFAPRYSWEDNQLTFAFYDPARHSYLPSAVDALAKLLATDEPNKTYYRSILTSTQYTSEPIGRASTNGTSTLSCSSKPPYALLSQAIGLAISPMPSSSLIPYVRPVPQPPSPPMPAKQQTHGKKHSAFQLNGLPEPSKLEEPAEDDNFLAISWARRAFFAQGMLAADILASMVPASFSPSSTSFPSSATSSAVVPNGQLSTPTSPTKPSHVPSKSLSRILLDSTDAWAPALMHLVVLLGTQSDSWDREHRQQPTTGSVEDFESKGFDLITAHGASLLRRLVEKAGRGSRDMENRSREEARSKKDASKEKDGIPERDGSRSPTVVIMDGLPTRAMVVRALECPASTRGR